MAQWSQAGRTVIAKLVYYGPAYGGKTTNLESLHRITDPARLNRLISVKTADDRTLFFDVLPVELGDILGYRVAVKVFTVPGQVRYNETRRIVLAGADAVVFVADSTRGREDENRDSLRNLWENLQGAVRDPGGFPVLYQFNKQDLPEAAPPADVAAALGVEAEAGVPAVALTGEGVLETFIAASRRMTERLVALADPEGRRGLDAEAMGQRVEESLSPFLSRSAAPAPGDRDSATDGSMVLEGDDSRRLAVEASVRLGEQLADAAGRSNRLEREAEALRGISRLLTSVGASFDRERIVRETLGAAGAVLDAPRVSLLEEPSPDVVIQAAALGNAADPLIRTAEGQTLLRGWIAEGRTRLIAEIDREVFEPTTATSLAGLRGVAVVPLADQPVPRAIVAYGAEPDGSFGEQDARFLENLAGHLAVGLEKSRLHAELERHRDRLEDVVESRTDQLRKAYDELRSLERMKDSFLANLSHEMKTPLTAMLGAAAFLREYEAGPEERREMLGSIVEAGYTLERQLDDLFRLVQLEGSATPLELAPTDAETIAREAVDLAGRVGVNVEIDDPGAWRGDSARLARAVANLLDNAVKFSGADASIELKVEPAPLVVGGVAVPGAAISVLDRGPGVPPEDSERIFAPFEQGGDPLTEKPRGVGIGLFEARNIARRHGGTLEYRPRPGGGSVFCLRVPLEPAGRAAASETRAAG